MQDAESYYRAMFRGRATSWNIRDTHMADTLDTLMAYLDRVTGAQSRVVWWAHNSHVGDAAATEAGAQGEVTLGRLVRDRHGDGCRLIGLTTHHGSVTAASDWGGDAERKVVRPGLAGSVEELFHEVGRDAFLVDVAASPPAADVLRVARLERAIGVIYRPQSERHSHYLHARPADQFDAIIHIDETRALPPLERSSLWVQGERPETYPSAL